jgi:hypothetical protein
MIPDVTLVTACFDLTKYNKHARTAETAKAKMESLLEIQCFLVIYCDSKTINDIKKIRNEQFGLAYLTQYIEMDFENIWAYRYVDIVRENRIKYHPTKDERTCPESHILCCNKFDFVLNAMDLDPFFTSKFGWIDSNIDTNAKKICEQYEKNMLPDILNKVTDKFHLQILNVDDKKYKNNNKETRKEYYQQYRWIVCGCLFITGKEIGVRILNRLKELFVETTTMGFGHGEEMLYISILDEFYDQIERSYGDYHNILNNFIKPTKGFPYINHNILTRYLNFRYYREGYECCDKLINEIDNVKIDDALKFQIYFKYYIFCYYYKRAKAVSVVNKINDLLQTSEGFRKEFEKNPSFYLDQFKFCA